LRALIQTGNPKALGSTVASGPFKRRFNCATDSISLSPWLWVFHCARERYVWSDNAGIGQLQSRLDWSPPSLYLFRHGEEPDVDLDRAIHSGQVAPDATSKKFSLVEVAGLKEGQLLRFKRTNSDEYTQSAFLLG
jgi:hypothetical protein